MISSALLFPLIPSSYKGLLTPTGYFQTSSHPVKVNFQRCDSAYENTPANSIRNRGGGETNEELLANKSKSPSGISV